MNKDGIETKLNFLQQEVKQLQEENKELRQLLQLNKEVIKIQKEFSIISQPSTTNSRRQEQYNDNNSGRGFQSLFTQLYEENNQLYTFNEIISKQRDEARSQALIFEQICEETNQRNIEIQLERQNQLIDMQKKISDKDQQILNLTEQLFEFQSKKKIKQRITVQPTEDVLAILNQVEQMRILIGDLIKENKSLKDENHKIQIIVEMLKRQLDGKQDIISPIMSPDQSMDESPQNMQSKLQILVGKKNQLQPIKEDDSSYVEMLPTKVNTQPKISAGISVPKLDLSKAQKLQQLNIQKQEEIEEKEELEVKALKMQQQAKQQQLKAQTPSSSNALNMFSSPNKLCIQLNQLTDQNKLLQKELAVCRQKLQNEILLTKTLEDQISEYERKINELEHINEILINSQIKLEQKWQKMHQQFTTYKEYYDENNQIYESARDSKSIQQTLMNMPLSAKHRKQPTLQNIREIAYSLYNTHKIDEKLKNIELTIIHSKQRAASL